MSNGPHLLEGWNPLKEEYYSVSFNSYNRGPGANLPLECLPAFSEDYEVVRSRTVCIKNLPVDITELGLRNLFGSCGQVLGAQRLNPKPEYPDKTIGFVDFRTTKEALEAISSLHDQPPFHLKVSIANMSLSDRWKIDNRMKDELDDIRRNIEQKHGLSSQNGPSSLGAGRGKSVLSYDRFTPEDLKTIRVDVGPKPGERRVYSSSSSSSSSGRSSRSSFSSDTSVETCILADSGDPDADTGTLQVSIKTSAQGEQVRKVVVLENPEQKCVLCGAYSEFLCTVCKAFYCSPECQLEDWPEHKQSCKPKGSLLPTPKERPAEDKSSLPRPNGHKSSPVKDKAGFPAKQGSQKSNAHPGGKQDKMHGKTGHTESPLGKYQEKSPSQPPNRPWTSPQSQPPAPKPAPAHPKADMGLSKCQPGPATLPLGEPVEVAFSFGNSLSEFFLQSFSQMPQLEALQSELQASCAKSTGAHLPTKGEICAALFKEDGQWYRAKVNSVGSSVCRVYFIDYGNMGTVAPENIRPLPEFFVQLPAQAALCRLHGVRPASAAAGWTTDATAMLAIMFQAGPVVATVHKQSGDLHYVELASKKGGQSLNEQLVANGLAVDFKAAAGPTAAATTASAAMAPGTMPDQQPERLRTVLELVKVGDKLPMQVTVSSKGVVWCLCLMQELAEPLVKVEKALLIDGTKLGGENRAHEVTVGDFVGSKSNDDGHWYRAYVTEKTADQHTVRYVDYGNEESNTALFPMASEHRDVPGVAVRVDSSDPTFFRTRQLVSFTVESIEGRTARGTATSDADGKSLGAVTLAPWYAGLVSEPSAKTSSGPSAPAQRSPTEPAPAPTSPKPTEPAPAPTSPKPTSPKPTPADSTRTEPAPTFAQRAPSRQSNVDAKVLHMPQRKFPSDKADMSLVWRTPDGLFLQQQSLTEELQDMMRALNTWVKRQSPEPSTAKYSKGDYVCALFSEDSLWYRGQVMSEQTSDGTYLVLFVDFGNGEQLPAASLRPLPPSFAEKPLFVFCVVPQNVPIESPRLAALLQQEPFTAMQVDTTLAGLPIVRLERKDGTCLNDLVSRAPHKDSVPAPQDEPPKSPAAVGQPLVSVADCPVPKSPFEAVIVAAEGNLVYIQPLVRAPGLVKITEVLANKSRRDPGYRFTEAPSVNQCVLALYPEDESWYRARVVSVDGSMVRVQFLDYGNTETLSVQLLLPMKEELAKAPASAIAVRLEGTPVLSPRAGEILSKEPMVLVELTASSDGPPLARLIQKGKCINSIAACSQQVPKKDYLERPLPTERTKAIISYVADDGLVYVHQHRLIPELQDMMAELNKSVPTTPLPSPSVGDMACARFAEDKLWYRVRVLSMPEDGKCKVSFVDFGNDDFVPLADIRPLPEKMSGIQLFGNPVMLQGVETVSKECSSQLLNVEVEYEVVDSSSQPCKVKIFAGEQCLNDLIE